MTVGTKLRAYVEWFLKNEERESDPSREVIEELVDEFGLLSAEDLEGIDSKLVGYYTEVAKTKRTGQEGVMTYRLVEVHDTSLPPETLQVLIELSKKEDALVRFVTPDEILSGVATTGEEIASITKSLIAYR